MDVMLETPSRVWRRIKDNEARNDDLPSLPSLSMDGDRDEQTVSMSFHRPMLPGLKKGFSSSEEEEESQVYMDASEFSPQRPTPTPKAKSAMSQRFTPVQSTPLASSGGRTVRHQTPGSTGSRVRFANAIETRSFTNESHEQESFDASRISYVSANGAERVHERLNEVDLNNSAAYDESQNSSESDPNPAVYNHEDELGEVSIVQETFPSPPAKHSPNTSRSPFDPTKWNSNIATRRKPIAAPIAQARFVPSLSHSLTDSSTEESTQLTPEAENVALPRSPSRSPGPLATSIDANQEHSEEQQEEERSGLTQIAEEDEEDLFSEDEQPQHEPSLQASVNTSAERTTRPAQQTRHTTPSSQSSSSLRSLTFSTPSSLDRSVNSSHHTNVPIAQLVPARFETPAAPTNRGGRNMLAMTRESLVNMPTSSQDYLASLATPAAKRAFQLIVTSTTKPRVKKGTPHPKPAAVMEVDEEQSEAGYSNAPTSGPVPSARPPQARARFSLPTTSNPLLFSTATSRESDGMSITSSSSHDLTIHPRANASFDPVYDNQGPRMDQTKLNAQLHRVNRMMEQENRILSEERDQLADMFVQMETERNEVAGERDEIAVERDELANECAELVKESEVWKARDKEWTAQKQELDSKVRELEAVVAQREAEAGRTHHNTVDMKEHQAALRKMQEDFAVRMEEAGSSAEHIVDSITKKTQTQIKELKKQVEAGDSKREGLEREVEYMRSELERARDDQKQRSDEDDRRQQQQLLQDQRDHIHALEAELGDVKREFARKMQEMRDVEEMLERTTEEHALTKDALESTRHDRSAQFMRKAELEEQIGELEGANDVLVETVADLKRVGEALQDKVTEMQGQLFEAERVEEEMERRVRRLKDEKAKAEDEVKEARDEARSLERTNEAMVAEKVTWEMKIAALERERDDLKVAVILPDPHQPSTSSTPEKHISLEAHREQVQALEIRLEHAHRDIGRLSQDLKHARQQLVGSSPNSTRRVKRLEDEKRELEERVESYKRIWDGVRNVETVVGKMGLNGTPNGSWATTPAKPTYKSMLALKTPRTPGAPLRDLSSWINQSLFATPAPNRDGSPSQATRSALLPAQLQTEISSLIDELHHANDRLDGKFEQLRIALEREAELMKEVEEAKEREVELVREAESAKVQQAEAKRRLEKCLCRWCGKQFDARATILGPLDASTKNGTSPNHKTDALEQAESIVAVLQKDKQRLQDEMAQLAAEAKRLNIHAGQTQRNAEKEKTRFEKELEEVQQVKDELERRVQQGEDRLQSMRSEKERLDKERKEMMTKVEKTERNMDQVQAELRLAKEREHELSNKLRANAASEQTVRHLEAKVSENQDIIHQLRQERESLESDREQLQTKVSQMGKQMDTLRQQLSIAQTTQDQARHRLEVHTEEIHGLRSVITESMPPKDRQPTQQQQRLATSAKQQGEVVTKSDQVEPVVPGADAKLRELRQDVESCLRELDELRTERDMLRARLDDERVAADRAHSQLQLLRKQLEGPDQALIKGKARAVNQDDHECCAGPSGDCQTLIDLRAQHKLEDKGLIVQIGYLKNRTIRESVMRTDLAYQKSYLLRIIGVMEQSEQSISSCIARIGFPTSATEDAPTKRPRRSLRIVAVAVMFLTRVRLASDRWREQSAAKHAVAAALQDMHRRREMLGKE
ncbi:hypothetical protein FRB93_001972 [Tulasnella sp. JGI-2019a]|nr:hypothetical protein FRB93_001972 [Tulasnella sp. JGI-2019a]